MRTKSAFIVVLALSVLLAACGCSKSGAAAVEGSVKAVDEGRNTSVSYAFVNRSGKTITVVGGARYTLEKDGEVFKSGTVPVKDYIDLHPGEAYRDSASFSDLPAGAYRITVEWNHVAVAADWDRS